jgi:hypothetical protein
MVSKLHIEMITEIYMTISIMTNDWWYDLGATFHVCNQWRSQRFLDEGANY